MPFVAEIGVAIALAPPSYPPASRAGFLAAASARGVTFTSPSQQSASRDLWQSTPVLAELSLLASLYRGAALGIDLRSCS